MYLDLNAYFLPTLFSVILVCFEPATSSVTYNLLFLLLEDAE